MHFIIKNLKTASIILSTFSWDFVWDDINIFVMTNIAMSYIFDIIFSILKSNEHETLKFCAWLYEDALKLFWL